MKKLLTMFAAAFALITVLAPAPDAVAHEKSHKLVIHVDENDKQVMTIALNNAANVTNYYQGKGEEVEIEIVAYGPGLMMLHAGKSPVKKRVESFEGSFPNITFAACGNTMKLMSKKTGKLPPLVSNAKVVTSGVVQIMTRQEQGWNYLRP
jgi:hypothetical protein